MPSSLTFDFPVWQVSHRFWSQDIGSPGDHRSNLPFYLALMAPTTFVFGPLSSELTVVKAMVVHSFLWASLAFPPIDDDPLHLVRQGRLEDHPLVGVLISCDHHKLSLLVL